MRVFLGVLTAAILFAGPDPISAQDLCSHIRLTGAEQFECRSRIGNAIGEGDRLRIQQEFEERVRRATDQLITPPPVTPLVVPPPAGPRVKPQEEVSPGNAAGDPPLAPLPVNPAGSLPPPR